MGCWFNLRKVNCWLSVICAFVTPSFSFYFYILSPITNASLIMWKIHCGVSAVCICYSQLVFIYFYIFSPGTNMSMIALYLLYCLCVYYPKHFCRWYHVLNWGSYSVFVLIVRLGSKVAVGAS